MTDGSRQLSAISPQQIRKIHALKNALAMSNDDYRTAVMDVHGFSGTSKDLSLDEAAVLIERLEASAIAAGVWKKREAKQAREGFATPRQEIKIYEMFKEVSWYDSRKQPKAFEGALRNFLNRIAGVQDTKWLPRNKVNKVIKALQAMKEKKNG